MVKDCVSLCIVIRRNNLRDIYTERHFVILDHILLPATRHGVPPALDLLTADR